MLNKSSIFVIYNCNHEGFQYFVKCGYNKTYSMTEARFIEIINIMISEGMLDKSKLLNKEYVINRVALYLKAKQFVDDNFKGF